MNVIDREMLVRQYIDAEQSVNNAYKHAVIRMQDSAYEMGLERGQGNINRVIKVFEQMTEAIDRLMIGDIPERDALDKITEAYELMDSLNKELQQ